MFKISRIKDIDEAITFIEECLDINFERHPRSKEYIKGYFLKYPEFFIGVYDKDTLVGVLFSYPDFNKKEVLLGEICIRKDYRGKGIGKRMISQFEEVCRKYGIRKIYGGIREGKEGFYIKLGYKLKLFITSQEEISKDVLLEFGERVEKKWKKDNLTYYIIILKRIVNIEKVKEKLENLKIVSIQYLFEKFIL